MVQLLGRIRSRLVRKEIGMVHFLVGVDVPNLVLKTNVRIRFHLQPFSWGGQLRLQLLNRLKNHRTLHAAVLIEIITWRRYIRLYQPIAELIRPPFSAIFLHD